MRYLMGIDNGGTFSKAALFDENGVQISVASVPTVTLTPKPGYTERDMEELWQVNAKAARQAIENKRDRSERDCGRVLFRAWKVCIWSGKDGKPAYNGIISTDARAWAYVKQWKEDGTAKKYMKRLVRTSLHVSRSVFSHGCGIMSREVLERTRYVFAVKDYVRYRMSGEAYAEYTDFSGGNLVNLHTGEYDRELLSYMGLDMVYENFLRFVTRRTSAVM